MNKILILISAIVVLSCGGSSDVAPSDTFVKFYGDNATYQLRDMILKTDNTGLVLFGTRRPLSGGVTDFFIIEIDLDGKELSRTSYPIEGAGNFDNDASRIRATANGYLVIGTRAYFDPNDAINVRPLAIWGELNASFALVGDWQIVGDSVNAYHGVEINQTADGGRVVAGYTNVNGTNDFFYRKIGGAQEWSRIQTRLNSDDRLVRALPLPNNEFVLVGRTDTPSEDGEGGVNVERTVINNEGIITNSQVYGITSTGNTNRDDFPYDVIAKPGGFAIVGASSGAVDDVRPFLMLVDLTGASSTETLYSAEFAGMNASAFGVTQTKINDYFIVGNIEDFIGTEQREDEVLVMRTDQDGTLLGEWKNFGLVNGNERGVRVLLAPDGSLFVGATYDFGGGLSQFALLKMNVEGELKK